MIIARKNDVTNVLRRFLEHNEFESRFQYKKIQKQINEVLKNAAAYRINVKYITSAGNNLASKEIALKKPSIDRFRDDPSLLMGKGEYNKYLKEKQKAALEEKHHEYYGKVNCIVDYANENRDFLVLNGSREEMDELVIQLFDRTVNSIKKIKTIDSEEWNLIKEFIARTETDIEKMAQRSFTVPMTEETIIELIKILESKLTAKAFAKEQRNLMTTKLREHIKARDNFTCCICGNSIQKEPNLLLEIDHIIPVSKGGCTTEENLQTLCWKCNRSKSSKIIS